MPEATLPIFLEGITTRMDTITNELLEVSKLARDTNIRIGAIEKCLSEVELIDTEGHKTTEPRGQFDQRINFFLMPGGTLDQKMKDCKENHNPTRWLRIKGEKVDIYEKWIYRLVTMAFVFYIVIKNVEPHKAMEMVKSVNHNEQSK